MVERLGDVLANRQMPQFSSVIKCQRCGTVNDVSENQGALRCKRCNLFISVAAPKRKTFAKYNCWACFDTGLIEYEKQVDSILYKSNCRCTCAAGNKWPSDILTWDKVIGCPDARKLAERNKEKAEELKKEHQERLEEERREWLELKRQKEASRNERA